MCRSSPKFSLCPSDLPPNGLRYLRVGGRGLPKGRVWEQEKLEAKKMLAAGAAESHTSGACFVGQLLALTAYAAINRLLKCAQPTSSKILLQPH
jgi:hypothetical protein